MKGLSFTEEFEEHAYGRKSFGVKLLDKNLVKSCGVQILFNMVIMQMGLFVVKLRIHPKLRALSGGSALMLLERFAKETVYCLLVR